MKVLIAADMEGISGVVHWDQVDSKHKECDRFRKLMTTGDRLATLGRRPSGPRTGTTPRLVSSRQATPSTGTVEEDTA